MKRLPTVHFGRCGWTRQASCNGKRRRDVAVPFLALLLLGAIPGSAHAHFNGILRYIGDRITPGHHHVCTGSAFGARHALAGGLPGEPRTHAPHCLMNLANQGDGKSPDFTRAAPVTHL